ncbi:MAG: hypothetical protein K2F57_00280 [Candidatus Gastranaerophilales bacterium]|nr:hypothetical protein [Candidatus Gastranaerophilales bacterium]
MKLNKYEKIITGIIAIIILYSGILGYSRYKTMIQFHHLQAYINTTEEHNIGNDIPELSKKYQAYENIYNSDKPIFIYGYNTHTFDKEDGLIFHEELTKKLENETINYKVISFKNWEDLHEELRVKYDPNSEGCTMESPDQTELNKILKLTSSCLINSCIIDSKAKKYYIISRDIDYIVSVLKESYPPKAEKIEDTDED